MIIICLENLHGQLPITDNYRKNRSIPCGKPLLTNLIKSCETTKGKIYFLFFKQIKYINDYLDEVVFKQCTLYVFPLFIRK